MCPRPVVCQCPEWRHGLQTLRRPGARPVVGQAPAWIPIVSRNQLTDSDILRHMTTQADKWWGGEHRGRCFDVPLRPTGPSGARPSQALRSTCLDLVPDRAPLSLSMTISAPAERLEPDASSPGGGVTPGAKVEPSRRPLKHWTDPDLYAAIVDDEPGRERTEIEVFYLERTGVDIAQVIQLQTLQATAGRRCSSGLPRGRFFQALSTNTTDPSHPRSLVHPSLYDDRRHLIRQPSQGRDRMRSDALERRDLRAERNTDERDAASGLACPVFRSGAGRRSSSECRAAADAAAFRHDPDYRHVRLRDREFSLTPPSGADCS